MSFHDHKSLRVTHIIIAGQRLRGGAVALSGCKYIHLLCQNKPNCLIYRKLGSIWVQLNMWLNLLELVWNYSLKNHFMRSMSFSVTVALLMARSTEKESNPALPYSLIKSLERRFRLTPEIRYSGFFRI